MLFFNLRLSVSGECRLMTANAAVVCVCGLFFAWGYRARKMFHKTDESLY